MAEPNLKPYSVDMYDHEVGEDGVSEYFWPITNKEVTNMGDDLMYAAADILRSYGDDHREAHIYKLVMKYYVAQFCGLFQAQKVKTGLEAAGYVPEVPEDWNIYPYIFKGQEPPLPHYVAPMLLRAKKENYVLQKLKNPARLWKNLKKLSLFGKEMKLDNLYLLPKNAEVLQNNIIATQRTPVINAHAAMLADEKVAYMTSSRWFSSISEEELSEREADFDFSIGEKLLGVGDGLYKKYDAVFDDLTKSHLRRVLNKLAVILSIHFDRLMARDDLPRRIWTGTAGNIWDVLLRTAVRMKGGHATGHDHGGGTAHVAEAILAYIELWGCDEFFSFNDHQAELISSYLEKWPRFDNNLPVIKGVRQHACCAHKTAFSASGKEIKKVVLMSTLYDRDRPRCFAFYPDLVYTDWQARLFGKLKSWGYEVYFKPHPESEIPPHPALSKKLGVTVIDGLFEDVKQEADLIILDYTFTSIMQPALDSDIPVILIDFDELKWYPQARELFEKRAPIIEGTYDENNRIVVNWGVLENAIETSKERTGNREFLNKFFF